MRLINAEELKSLIKDYPEWNTFNKDRAIKIIDNAPTVAEDYDTGYQYGLEDGLNDIRPHGKWIYQPNHTNLDNVKKYHCSTNKCGWQQQYKTNFCPNCGADMREGVDNGEK